MSASSSSRMHWRVGKLFPLSSESRRVIWGRTWLLTRPKLVGVDVNFIDARRTLTAEIPKKCRTDDAHRQRVFESRDNRPEDHPDDVKGPELKVVAVRQGKEELPLPYSVCA